MSDDKKQNPESKETSAKNDQPEQVSKRKTMRKMLTGGGVIASGALGGSKWVKPAIDSVTLPAHAQGSPIATPAPSGAPTPQPTPSPSGVPTTPQPTPAPTEAATRVPTTESP
jgi:hypothetical protein